MNNDNKQFDVIIIGGGLAGLALSIQLGRKGYRIALFEKEAYPFHKVCGEYISMESWNFIESLGLPLSSMNLPFIKNLMVTSPNGNMLTAKLPLGGFGISRYTIDEALKNIAVANNVSVYEKCKVEEVAFADESFKIQTSCGDFSSKLCCGSYGKRSNLDIKWKRHFVSHKNNKLSNYVGVKYHIKTVFASDTIALHNFKNGYCGISKIEGDKYCLCYLTNAANLKENDNSIEALEKNILRQNPHLKTILDRCEHLYPAPVTISQISFSHKTQVENHVLLLGDAAGSITPLCGNGMSMALHASKIAASLILDFMGEKFDRTALEKNYQKQWKQLFAKRLFIGRMIQHLFGEKWVTNLFVMVMKTMPWLTRLLIKQTHGEAF
jgi:flavin-dependent dehydrogenase